MSDDRPPVTSAGADGPPKGAAPLVLSSQDGSQLPTLLRGDWVRDVTARGEYIVLEKKAGGGVMLDEAAVRLAAFGFGFSVVRTGERVR